MRLYEKTAAELSHMLQQRECSAVELLTEVQSRIRQAEDTVGAYITLNERSMECAKAVDAARHRGETLHPLAGIPIAVKDNISTKGLRTTCASRMLEHYVPPFDASVMQKIHAAGMVLMGKTNMDEFAMGSSTETSCLQQTRNPHHPDYVPGGSSGGSAAALACGEAILALGSDTGGSIRQPAAFCGVVGLKPTYGSVSRYGLIAYASSFDQIGPMGRSVRDAAMLLSLICGHDPMDATSARRKYPDFAAELNADVQGLRIGIPKEYFGDGVEDAVKEAAMKALGVLEARGAVLKEISLPSTTYAISTYYILASAEASSNLARYDGVKFGYRTPVYDSLAEMYEKTRSEGFGDEVKRRIMLGSYVLSAGFQDAYYQKARRVQGMIAREFDGAFRECDVIAVPTAPTPAFRIGEHRNDPVRMYSSDICTVTANIAGLPAISIPCGKTGVGLPIGLQLIGDRFDEQRLLNTAYAYEESVGGFGDYKAVGI